MDQTREQTDKILSQMEKKVNSIYSRADKEMREKWDKYMKSHEPKVKSAYEELQKAIELGDKKVIDEAKLVYERTVKNVTLNNERYKVMVDETTSRIAHTNEVALDYLNDRMPEVYTINYNSFADEKVDGYSFTLVNEQAIRNLAKEDKSLLPTKKLDIPKDKQWNTKNMNAEVLQGILQGESIPKIAKRLEHVTDMNRKSAIRNARTMTTGAENKGKNDSFRKATSDGVILKRVWIAASDGRTRDWHADLDGQETNVDEAWVNDYGEIMYPGDPGADPANVYNCRCAIAAEVKGFKWNQSNIEKPSSIMAKSNSIERLQSAVGESYEYHRINNGLRATALDDLDKDFFKVQLTKMDDDTKEAFVSQFEYLSSKYDTTVQAIKPMDKLEYLSHKDSFATTYHNYDVDSSVISYNPVKISNVDRVKELISDGYATRIKEEFADRYVITHEFAHTLIDMGSELNNSRNWMNADYKRITSIRKEINGVYDRYIKEIGALDNAQKQAQLTALTTFDEKAWSDSARLLEELKSRSLGRYSLVNSDEFMAECFTHFELGGTQNDYVDEVMGIINKHFGR